MNVYIRNTPKITIFIIMCDSAKQNILLVESLQYLYHTEIKQ